jgi:hypothetical protein
MLRLVPMTQSEFDSYLERAVPEYAQAHIRAGDCDPGEALALAQADYASLLPLGLATPNHHLFTIRDGEESVGIMWFQARQADSQVGLSLRLQRGGGAAPQGLRSPGDARPRGDGGRHGITRVNLNVMGYNDAARALYEQCGYRIAGIGNDEGPRIAAIMTTATPMKTATLPPSFRSPSNSALAAPVEREQDRWNLADMYPTVAAWDADHARVESQVPQILACKASSANRRRS